MYLGAFLAGLFSIVVFKISVMILLGWLLWRVGVGVADRKGASLQALGRAEYGVAGKFMFWGLLSFFVSEVTCGIEVYILLGPNPYFRLAHSFSSAVGAGLLIYGLFVMLDRRALHYFDEGRACFLIPICKDCPKRNGKDCKFHPAYFWGMCIMVLAGVPLLFIPVRELVADPAVTALPFDSLNNFFDEKIVPFMQRWLPHWRKETMYFVLPKELTLAEFRIVPIASMLLGTGAVVLSFWKKYARISFLLACLSAGPLAYAYLEAVCYHIIPQVYLGSIAHEVAELLGLVLLRSVLYNAVGSDQ